MGTESQLPTKLNYNGSHAQQRKGLLPFPDRSCPSRLPRHPSGQDDCRQQYCPHSPCPGPRPNPPRGPLLPHQEGRRCPQALGEKPQGTLLTDRVSVTPQRSYSSIEALCFANLDARSPSLA